MVVEFGDISFTASSNQAAVQQQSNPASPSTQTYSVGDTYTGDYISTTAGVITGYVGNGGSITIPDALPVVEASSSTFNATTCELLMDDETWCAEAQKKYNNQPYDEHFDDEDGVYDYILALTLDSVYVVSTATPQTITGINDAVFFSKGITSVSIPSSVTSIGQGAFAENANLTVTIHNTEGMVQMGNSAFQDDATITYVGTGQ